MTAVLLPGSNYIDLSSRTALEQLRAIDVQGAVKLPGGIIDIHRLDTKRNRVVGWFTAWAV